MLDGCCPIILYINEYAYLIPQEFFGEACFSFYNISLVDIGVHFVLAVLPGLLVVVKIVEMEWETYVVTVFLDRWVVADYCWSD